jgi:deoxyribonuclease-4
MDIGAHVSSSGGLTSALGRGVEIGVDAVQIFTQSPRMWRSSSHTAEACAAYREAQASHPSIKATYCHATYLINLAADGELLEKSHNCLVENLVVATAIGASGVVLHVGSHRGSGFDAVLEPVSKAVRQAIGRASERIGAPPCPLLLENAAGSGGTVGRSFDELAAIIDAAGSDGLGVCLDTQHLFASGVDYSTIPAADAFVRQLDAGVGLERLGCLHLNDSKVPFGANRDRHENLGDGEIGLDALGALLGHPRLQHLTALLEVPGDGDGPRASDVTVARATVAAGQKARGRGTRKLTIK